MSVVIPDSIEPVVGWKVLTIRDGGTLSSPTYPMHWIPGKKTEAECTGDLYFTWELVDEDVPEEPPSVEEVLQWFPGTYLNTPTDPPPPGKRWKSTVTSNNHQIPNNLCSCGIYIASRPEITDQYSSSYNKDVLVEMKGWGNVIEYQDGWRTQFAYPSAIYVKDQKTAELISPDYEVPVVLYKKAPPEVKRVKVRSKALFVHLALIIFLGVLLGITVATGGSLSPFTYAWFTAMSALFGLSFVAEARKI